MTRNVTLYCFLMGIAALMTGCKTTNLAGLMAKGAQPVEVFDQGVFTEGPVADREGNVYFTDQPNNRIMKWSVDGVISVFLEDCGRSNGLYVDNEGSLLACADEKNQLWRIGKDKKVEVLISDFKGKKLNGPNDLWVDRYGRIYFTDPYYRRDYWTNKERELKRENLYCYDPRNNSLVIADSNLVKPNGIVGDARKNILYVADIGDSKTYSYKIGRDGTLSDRKLFATMGSDGMTLDKRGNLYLTGKGVTIYNNRGVMIGNIPITQRWTSNVAFGGKKHNTLFITAMNSLYAVDMKVRGN